MFDQLGVPNTPTSPSGRNMEPLLLTQCGPVLGQIVAKESPP